jgi:hypothetical protein
MKNASRNVLILTVILMALSIGIPAFAAEGDSPSTAPGSAFDEWDDDVWSDWGAQPSTTKGGAPELADKESTGEGATSASGGPGSSIGFSGGSSFGESKGKVQFNLVREGVNDEPKGVRKFRPAYKRKTL